MSRRAIFMDRDGTISAEVGYVNHTERFRLLPRSVEAIERINASDFLSFVITNQSGVARGLFDEALVEKVHGILLRSLEERGARLDGIYFCPHHPGEGSAPFRRECDCRKPRPGMIRRAAREHDLDLSGSYVIGDSVLDIETARNAGATGVLVLTGYGKGDLEFRMKQRGVEPAYVAADLLEAVDWILDRENGT